MSHHGPHDEQAGTEDVVVFDEDGAPAQADAETLAAYGGEAPLPSEEVEDAAGEA